MSDTLDDLPLRHRIRWLRENGPHGKLSHDRLAAQLGTTRQTIINWENGSRPKEHYVVKLARFFDVPAETFRVPVKEKVSLRSLADRLEELEAALADLQPLLGRVEDLQGQLDGLSRRVADGRPRSQAETIGHAPRKRGSAS